MTNHYPNAGLSTAAGAQTLAIAYRIYPRVSKIPPVNADDKLKLAELCLKSFANALAGIDYHMWAILDGCPDEYYRLLGKYIDPARLELITTDGIGNAATFAAQLKILASQTFSENVYFAEDDYFYLPAAIKEMLGFMQGDPDCDYLTPYDHLDYYNLALHDHRQDVAQSNKRRWSRRATTCMTFMTRKARLVEDYRVFYSYARKNYDTSLWMALTKIKIFSPGFYLRAPGNMNMLKVLIKAWAHTPLRIMTGRRRCLRSPQPSLATHMDSECLAPGIDWQEEFEKLNKIIFYD